MEQRWYHWRSDDAHSALVLQVPRMGKNRKVAGLALAGSSSAAAVDFVTASPSGLGPTSYMPTTLPSSTAY